MDKRESDEDLGLVSVVGHAHTMERDMRNKRRSSPPTLYVSFAKCGHLSTGEGCHAHDDAALSCTFWKYVLRMLFIYMVQQSLD